MESKITEPANFEWLIHSRTDVQLFMLRLYKYSESSKTASDPSIFNLFVGSCFSLWRAAFLADASREPVKIDRAVCDLLSKLLEDNTINYSQDRQMSDWMGGYYLNNARHRVVNILEKLEKTETVQGPKIEAFRELHKRGISVRTDSRVLWKTIFDAQTEAFDIYQQRNNSSHPGV